MAKQKAKEIDHASPSGICSRSSGRREIQETLSASFSSLKIRPMGTWKEGTGGEALEAVLLITITMYDQYGVLRVRNSRHTRAITVDEAATSWMQRISIRLLNKISLWNCFSG